MNILRPVGIVGMLLLAVLAPQMAFASDRYSSIHTVGIIAALGDRIEVVRYGPLAGQDRTSEFLEFPGWHINDRISGWIAHALAPRFTIKILPAQSPTRRKDCIFNPECAKEVLPAADVDPGVDAYIVVFAQAHGFFAHVWSSGLGVDHSEPFFGHPSSSMYADFAIYVYDGKGFRGRTRVAGERTWTHRQINHGSAGMPTHDAYPFAFTHIENELWSRQASGYTPQQIDIIKGRMTRLVAIGLAVALVDADLATAPTLLDDRNKIDAMVLGTTPLPYFADAPNPPSGPDIQPTPAPGQPSAGAPTH